MVCAAGKVKSIESTVVIIGVYLEPKTKASTLLELTTALADFMLEIKAGNNDPMFIIGGDVNKRDISGAFVDFVDVAELATVPHVETKI